MDRMSVELKCCCGCTAKAQSNYASDIGAFMRTWHERHQKCHEVEETVVHSFPFTYSHLGEHKD